MMIELGEPNVLEWQIAKPIKSVINRCVLPPE